LVKQAPLPRLACNVQDVKVSEFGIVRLRWTFTVIGTAISATGEVFRETFVRIELVKVRKSGERIGIYRPEISC